MADCRRQANGDVLPCSSSLPLISTRKIDFSSSGIVIEACVERKNHRPTPSCFSWLKLGTCFQSSNPRNTRIEMHMSDGRGTSHLRIISLLGSATELFVGSKADAALRTWCSTDSAAFHALTAAARFAAEGKAFQLRLQQHANSSSSLPHLLLLADYGTRQGDLLIQSCLVQCDAAEGCTSTRPAVLIRTAPRAPGFSASGCQPLAERPPPSPLPGDNQYAVAVLREDCDTAASGTAPAPAPAPAGGKGNKDQLTAISAVTSAGVASTSEASSSAVDSARADVACCLQRKPLTQPAGAVSAAVLTAPSTPPPPPPAWCRSVSPLDAEPNEVQNEKGFSPQLLASACMDDGPSLVTIVQYPGDVVQYQNKRSLELLGDLSGRPVGRLLLHQLISHRDKAAGVAGATSRRGGPESLTLVDSLLKDVARGKTFSCVVSVQPGLSFRLAMRHTGSSEVTAVQVPRISPVFGNLSCSRGAVVGAVGDHGGAGTAASGPCAVYASDGGGGLDSATNAGADPWGANSVQGLSDYVTLNTNDSLDRKLLAALASQTDLAPPHLCRRPLTTTAGLVTAPERLGMSDCLIGRAHRLSVPLRSLGVSGAGGGADGGGGSGAGGGEGSNATADLPVCVIRTESEDLTQRCDGAGLMTASASATANIGIFVGGGEADGDDEGGLVGELASPLPSRPRRHHMQPQSQLTQPQLKPQSPLRLHIRPPQQSLPSLGLLPVSLSRMQQQQSASTGTASTTGPPGSFHGLWAPASSAPSCAAALPPSRSPPGASLEASAPLPMLHALVTYTAALPTLASTSAGVGCGADVLFWQPPAHTRTLQRLREAAAAVAAFKKRQAPRRMSSAIMNVTATMSHSSPLVKVDLATALTSVPQLTAKGLCGGCSSGGARTPPSCVPQTAKQPAEQEESVLSLGLGCTVYAVPTKARPYGVGSLVGSCARRLTSTPPYLGTIEDDIEGQSGSNHDKGSAAHLAAALPDCFDCGSDGGVLELNAVGVHQGGAEPSLNQTNGSTARDDDNRIIKRDCDDGAAAAVSSIPLESPGYAVADRGLVQSAEGKQLMPDHMQRAMTTTIRMTTKLSTLTSTTAASAIPTIPAAAPAAKTAIVGTPALNIPPAAHTGPIRSSPQLLLDHALMCSPPSQEGVLPQNFEDFQLTSQLRLSPGVYCPPRSCQCLGLTDDSQHAPAHGNLWRGTRVGEAGMTALHNRGFVSYGGGVSGAEAATGYCEQQRGLPPPHSQAVLGRHSVGLGPQRRRPAPHTDAQNRVRQLLNNFASLRSEGQQQQEHHHPHYRYSHQPHPAHFPVYRPSQEEQEQQQQLQPASKLASLPQQQQQQQQQQQYRVALWGPSEGSATVTASGYGRVQFGGTDTAGGGDGNGAQEPLRAQDLKCVAVRNLEPDGDGVHLIAATPTHGPPRAGGTAPVAMTRPVVSGALSQLHARHLLPTEVDGTTMVTSGTALAVSREECNGDFRTCSIDTNNGGYCSGATLNSDNATTAIVTAAAGIACSLHGSSFRSGHELVEEAIKDVGGSCVNASGVDCGGDGAAMLAGGSPTRGRPNAVTWHKMYLSAITGPLEATPAAAVRYEAEVKAEAAKGGDGGGSGGEGNGFEFMPRPHAAAGTSIPSPALQPSHSLQQQERQSPMLLMITQMDVTAQVTAQRETAGLLQEEHKVLESIFPRHCIEYLTLRSSSGRGRAGFGAGRGNHGSRFTAAATSSHTPFWGMKPSAASAGVGRGGGTAIAGITANATTTENENKLAALEAGSARLASLATWHHCVTILFCDIVGFTSACSSTTPFTVMSFLNDLYSRFDSLVDIYKVYKVETIGDCYMVAGGLVAYDEDGYKSVISGMEDPLHSLRTLEFAKAILRVSREVRMPHTGEPVQLRVGLHSGPVTSGVVGETMPRFCLFGDTVNVASRMESTCNPGRIHVSAATQSRLPNEAWRDLGMTAVKGKGMMRTYEWAGDVDGPLDGEQVTRVLGLYL